MATVIVSKVAKDEFKALKEAEAEIVKTYEALKALCKEQNISIPAADIKATLPNLVIDKIPLAEQRKALDNAEKAVKAKNEALKAIAEKAKAAGAKDVLVIA